MQFSREKRFRASKRCSDASAYYKVFKDLALWSRKWSNLRQRADPLVQRNFQSDNESVDHFAALSKNTFGLAVALL